MSSRGLLVVISSPSGAGKTTLCRRLMDEFEDLKFSVSYTTRKPRGGEKNGVDYVFVDPETFQKMIDTGEFAEWAEVHGNRYGTTRAAVAEALAGGKDVLFDIDWQGGRQLKAQFAQDSVLIWILPPSLQVLEQRLRGRATDAPEVIERRLQMAHEELKQYLSYDYVVVNEDLETAYDEVRAIYIASHLITARNSAPAEKLLNELRGS